MYFLNIPKLIGFSYVEPLQWQLVLITPSCWLTELMWPFVALAAKSVKAHISLSSSRGRYLRSIIAISAEVMLNELIRRDHVLLKSSNGSTKTFVDSLTEDTQNPLFVISNKTAWHYQMEYIRIDSHFIHRRKTLPKWCGLWWSDKSKQNSEDNILWKRLVLLKVIWITSYPFGGKFQKFQEFDHK